MDQGVSRHHSTTLRIEAEGRRLVDVGNKTGGSESAPRGCLTARTLGTSAHLTNYCPQRRYSLRHTRYECLALRSIRIIITSGVCKQCIRLNFLAFRLYEQDYTRCPAILLHLGFTQAGVDHRRPNLIPNPNLLQVLALARRHHDHPYP